MNCGFELLTEIHLLNSIVADGYEQYWNMKHLFVSIMRLSKLLNIHYSAVPIYGAASHIKTYGDLIQHVSMLDFLIRYRLGKIATGVYDRDGWNIKDLSAEYIKQILNLDENAVVGDQIKAGESERSVISPQVKILMDHVFEGHILGK